jgi:hypothetical protein
MSPGIRETPVIMRWLVFRIVPCLYVQGESIFVHERIHQVLAGFEIE